MSSEFDLNDHTTEKTTVRIRELRSHLRDELLPGARGHAQSDFLLPFVEYLDRQAERFETSLEGPEDLLALATRNLLEFLALLHKVFINRKTRAEFLGEMYVDAEEIRARAEKMGIPRHILEAEPPEWEDIPEKRLAIMRDKSDDYFFKLCSKYIHPSAVSILAPKALPGPLIFYVFGCNYLMRSYNFLVDRVFSGIDLAGEATFRK
jgi:hypothetical protein